MLVARGELCLMVDADGATKFSDLSKLINNIEKIENNGQGVAVGSRSHLVTTEAVVKVVLISFFSQIQNMTY
jgi:dolichyl-phosphate beta-glucosyltransferase